MNNLISYAVFGVAGKSFDIRKEKCDIAKLIKQVRVVIDTAVFKFVETLQSSNEYDLHA